MLPRKLVGNRNVTQAHTHTRTHPGKIAKSATFLSFPFFKPLPDIMDIQKAVPV